MAHWIVDMYGKSGDVEIQHLCYTLGQYITARCIALENGMEYRAYWRMADGSTTQIAHVLADGTVTR